MSLEDNLIMSHKDLSRHNVIQGLSEPYFFHRWTFPVLIPPIFSFWFKHNKCSTVFISKGCADKCFVRAFKRHGLQRKQIKWNPSTKIHLTLLNLAEDKFSLFLKPLLNKLHSIYTLKHVVPWWVCTLSKYVNTEKENRRYRNIFIFFILIRTF